MSQLGRTYGQGLMVHVETLAEAEDVPANYLVQILNELRISGLIVSKRGKQGGYALSRAPKRILLSEIVQALDPELLESNCAYSGHSGERVSKIWSLIGADLCKQLESYTLEAFIVNDQGEMYYI
ncbi:MAG: Putative HTH-type transcriptional regulator [Opitutia bacterium UBA7350]|nr:MAG: Putative HTH-type transcriptional regulator [Opitutae bacterium UBA7350]